MKIKDYTSHHNTNCCLKFLKFFRKYPKAKRKKIPQFSPRKTFHLRQAPDLQTDVNPSYKLIFRLTLPLQKLTKIFFTQFTQRPLLS